MKSSDFPDQQRAEKIRELYRTCFRREPDDGGWTNHYGSGKPIEVLAKEFLSSREYALKRYYWDHGYDVTKIIDRLFVGTRMEKGKENRVVEKYQIQAVVNVDHSSKYDQRKFEYSFYCPFRDGHLMPVEQAVFGVHAIRDFINAGKNTLVHCRWGGSRSPSLAAFYLASARNCSFEDGFQIVKSARPDVKVTKGLLTPERIREVMSKI